MSCGQGMDRLGLLGVSASSESLIVPTALSAQQQERLAMMRDSLTKIRASPVVGSDPLVNVKVW